MPSDTRAIALHPSRRPDIPLTCLDDHLRDFDNLRLPLCVGLVDTRWEGEEK